MSKSVRAMLILAVFAFAMTTISCATPLRDLVAHNQEVTDDVDFTTGEGLKCAQKKTLKEAVTCIATEIYPPTEDRKTDFYKIAQSWFTQKYVDQTPKYYIIQLEDLANKLRIYTRFFSTTEAKKSYTALYEEIKECKNKFIFKVWNTDKIDSIEDKPQGAFKFYRQFIGIDCQNPQAIHLMFFEGSRKGTVKKAGETEFIKKFAQDSLFELVKAHFGA